MLISWLKETTMRELLVHVLKEIDPNLCLDDIAEIHISVMQHVSECDSFGVSRKRSFVP